MRTKETPGPVRQHRPPSPQRCRPAPRGEGEHYAPVALGSNRGAALAPSAVPDRAAPRQVRVDRHPCTRPPAVRRDRPAPGSRDCRRGRRPHAAAGTSTDRSRGSAHAPEDRDPRTGPSPAPVRSRGRCRMPRPRSVCVPRADTRMPRSADRVPAVAAETAARPRITSVVTARLPRRPADAAARPIERAARVTGRVATAATPPSLRKASPAAQPPATRRRASARTGRRKDRAWRSCLDG